MKEILSQKIYIDRICSMNWESIFKNKNSNNMLLFFNNINLSNFYIKIKVKKSSSEKTRKGERHILIIEKEVQHPKESPTHLRQKSI